MTWTVACFCGNVYTTPPDRCEVCGDTIESGPLEDTVSPAAECGIELHGVLARSDFVLVRRDRDGGDGRA